MGQGDFIWADLSTYNTEKSLSFYERVFGWQMSNDNSYHVASLNDSALAGVFETPSYLKKIGMPHFWMSYFQVENTAETVSIAKKLNGIIEMESVDFYGGKIALIRDPQGAGFTIYDGDKLGYSPGIKLNAICSTELHVSNIKKVIPFYKSIFNWEFEFPLDRDSTYVRVKNVINNNITLHQYENNIKGKYEYWVTTISVDDMSRTLHDILDHGGAVVMREDNRILVTDNSGEAFFYITNL